MKFDCDDKLLCRLKYIIHFAVRALAVLMVFVIVMGVIDVAWMIYEKLFQAPRFILTISDMLATFGAFMAVLIAIEIFVNITIYLREDIIHVKIVMATALMAIARKVIILDIEKVEPPYIYSIAAVVLAMSAGYWLVHKLSSREHHEEDDSLPPPTITPQAWDRPEDHPRDASENPAKNKNTGAGL